MNQANHISEEDLTLIALQFLPEKELPEALAHVAQCPACKEELARLQGDLAAYAHTVEMHSPPAYARERLLRKIAKEKKLVYGRRSGVVGASGDAGATGSEEEFAAYAEPSPRMSGFWPWAGWAVAAALGLVSVLQFTNHQHAESQYQAQLTQMQTESARAQQVLETLTDSRAKQVGIHLAAASAGDASKHFPEAHAAYMADKGSLVFFASNLQPLQQYKTYELWLLPANGRDPIAAGVFKPDANGNANVLIPNLPKGVPASGFGVTIEDEGGAKQPTLPIVMSGS